MISQDISEFKPIVFPVILLDLYLQEKFQMSLDFLQHLQFREWISRGNWKEGYNLKVNPIFHHMFVNEDCSLEYISKIEITIDRNGGVTNWFEDHVGYKVKHDDYYGFKFGGESHNIIRKIYNNQLRSDSIYPPVFTENE